ncbi:MAG: hypothetical protein P1U74_04510 [Legionellaceae bacterium]|nr:hypothetical protein [Legionellaceae bacterium]
MELKSGETTDLIQANQKINKEGLLKALDRYISALEELQNDYISKRNGDGNTPESTSDMSTLQDLLKIYKNYKQLLTDYQKTNNNQRIFKFINYLMNYIEKDFIGSLLIELNDSSSEELDLNKLMTKLATAVHSDSSKTYIEDQIKHDKLIRYYSNIAVVAISTLSIVLYVTSLALVMQPVFLPLFISSLSIFSLTMIPALTHDLYTYKINSLTAIKDSKINTEVPGEIKDEKKELPIQVLIKRMKLNLGMTEKLEKDEASAPPALKTSKVYENFFAKRCIGNEPKSLADEVLEKDTSLTAISK